MGKDLTSVILLQVLFTLDIHTSQRVAETIRPEKQSPTGHSEESSLQVAPDPDSHAETAGGSAL